MKIGLIGLPGSGKSTLLRLLTRGQAGGPGKARIGAAPVPDSRVDQLSAIFQPRRTVYAQLECTELPGLTPAKHAPGGGNQAARELAEALRPLEAIVQVVRAFEAPHVPHPLGSVDPLRDAQLLWEEFLLMDWSLVETRLERLAEARKKGLRHDEEVRLFERMRPHLEAGRPVRSMDFSPGERALLKPYSFLTAKPVAIAVNVDDDQLRAGTYAGREELSAWASEQEAPLVEVAALIEAEIEELPPEERAEFLEDIGLAEPGIARLARSAYEALDLISFFTVGSDEVRAWTVRRGATAREAAGVIHSDIERGFIRAEVACFDDVVREGSLTALKEKGLLRIEGKDYLIQDGEIVHFRFNV
ncbi:MAG: redox-regulated ATPase YchF [Firmicutes bacterium]|nr:redox-regulated ATPase YchF [Bacillota bacterium]